ncbi:MAG: hypothetical protein KF901_21095 [Myxococcales bacterium]|nr:hypothetical protein [Myxococcales bacterium]
MDRERLDRWLAGPRRTWRWNRGDATRYTAVEATGRGLRWFRWSHEVEGGGMSDEIHQAHATFLASGPPETMADAPPTVQRELRAWIEALPR